MRYAWTELASPVGPLTVAVTTVGLVKVSFGSADLSALFPGGPSDLPAELGAVRTQLAEYFAGRRRRFDLPLDWRLSSGQQRRVLRELYDGVGYGRTVSYQELGARTDLAATMPGHEVPRAIGGIMGSNPIPVVVPCHRVIASDGGLGGFARGYADGLEIKRRLLGLEGVLPLTFDDLLAFPDA